MRLRTGFVTSLVVGSILLVLALLVFVLRQWWQTRQTRGRWMARTGIHDPRPKILVLGVSRRRLKQNDPIEYDQIVRYSKIEEYRYIFLDEDQPLAGFEDDSMWFERGDFNTDDLGKYTADVILFDESTAKFLEFKKKVFKNLGKCTLYVPIEFAGTTHAVQATIEPPSSDDALFCEFKVRILRDEPLETFFLFNTTKRYEEYTDNDRLTAMERHERRDGPRLWTEGLVVQMSDTDEKQNVMKAHLNEHHQRVMMCQFSTLFGERAIVDRAPTGYTDVLREYFPGWKSQWDDRSADPYVQITIGPPMS